MTGQVRRIGRSARSAAAVLLVAGLTACSVPREADLAVAPSAAPTRVALPTPDATTSPTPSPSASPSPLREKVPPPVPRAVAKYALTAPPRGLGDPLKAVRGAGDLFGAVTVKTVAQGDSPVGLLFLFAVRPRYVGDPKISSLVLPKVVAGVTGGGITVKTQRFGRQQVAVGSSAKKGTIVLWYAGGVLAVVVGGGEPSTVTDYARAYVTRR